MKISLNYIKNNIEFNTPVEQIERLLTLKLANVEQVIDYGIRYKDIVLGEIKSVSTHPNADKLLVYTVDIGGGVEKQVIAGDKTLKVGDKVAYLKVGSTVPNNAYPEKFDGVIRASELRGILSDGMMASAKELDINNDHTHVLRIDTTKETGTPIAEVLGLDDTLIDIENKGITNRADCFGLVGLVRDIAAIVGVNYKSPEWFSYQDTEPSYPTTAKYDYNLDINILDPNLCKRFAGVILKNVEVKESPLWMQIELKKADITPVNNVVDITNYIMLLTGQPSHAYDLNTLTLEDNKLSIVARRAENGEVITLLNGQQKELDSDTLVISDKSGPQGIAGIMGGKSSEISEETNVIFLEVASFEPYNIRKTGNKYGISSDAQIRFARGQDPYQVSSVILKLVEILGEYANADIASSFVDIFPAKTNEKRSIVLNLNRVNNLIGANFTLEEVIAYLNSLEMIVEVKNYNDGTCLVVPPTFRPDINIEEDLIEEIVRLYGYDRVKTTYPTRRITVEETNKIIDLKFVIRKFLASNGMNEMISYNFLSKNNLQILNQDIEKSYHLINPISKDLEYMRQNVITQLIFKGAKILDRRDKVDLFELNKSHVRGVIGQDGLPIEFEGLGIMHTDRRNNELKDFYYIVKESIELLLQNLRTPKPRYKKVSEVELNDSLKAVVQILNEQRSSVVGFETDEGFYVLGLLGELKPEIINRLKLNVNTSIAELDLSVLTKFVKNRKINTTTRPYNFVSEDYCFVGGLNAIYEQLDNIFVEIQNSITDAVKIDYKAIDIYELETGKQFTFRVTFYRSDRNISMDEVNLIKSSIISRFVQEGFTLKA